MTSSRLARALARVAELKATRPDHTARTNREHLARAIEARRRAPTATDRIAERLRGLGYEVLYGFDADLGDYAEVRADGQTVARANRLGSVEACLRQVAGELGVET